MGAISKNNHFSEAGLAEYVYFLRLFGEPARLLFTNTKTMTLPWEITITDGEQNVVYRAKSLFFPQRAETDIFDAADNLVAHIERKNLANHSHHFVSMTDGTTFEFTNELLHQISAITNIEGLSWQLRGDILSPNYKLYDQKDQIISVSTFIAEQVISQYDKQCICIYKPEHEKTIVAIFITLLCMIWDRENSTLGCAMSSSSD